MARVARAAAPGVENLTCQHSSEVESLMISGRIRRLIVLVAAMTGLIGLFETAANAGTNLNHCEPVRRA
jgi:hypothetical protein